MRKALHRTVAVFIFSGLLLQWAARWSPVVFSRLYPPTGSPEASSSEDPATAATAEE